MSTEFISIAATQTRDSQGETLDIAGADISELEAGRGVVNDNHSNKMGDVIGRITYAKKIFGPEDCDDTTQKRMWDKVKAPYIFTKGILFDEQDHRSAKAAAAIIKHQHTFDSPLRMKCSVEGGILERGKDERHLKRTKIRGLALTLTPANNATLVEGLNLAKSSISAEEQNLIKSYKPQANVPTFIEVADQLSKAKIQSNVQRIRDLMKTLSAGYGGAGSSTNLTQGGVLQPESIEIAKTDHIVCQDCGKDQQYLKYQSKCRHCDKSFQFDNLAKFFLKR